MFHIAPSHSGGCIVGKPFVISGNTPPVHVFHPAAIVSLRTIMGMFLFIPSAYVANHVILLKFGFLFITHK